MNCRDWEGSNGLKGEVGGNFMMGKSCLVGVSNEFYNFLGWFGFCLCRWWRNNFRGYMGCY